MILVLCTIVYVNGLYSINAFSTARFIHLNPQGPWRDREIHRGGTEFFMGNSIMRKVDGGWEIHYDEMDTREMDGLHKSMINEDRLALEEKFKPVKLVNKKD